MGTHRRAKSGTVGLDVSAGARTADGGQTDTVIH